MGIREVTKALQFANRLADRGKLKKETYEGKTKGSGIIANTIVSASQHKFIIDLLDRPVSPDLCKNRPEMLRLTTGMYYIRYYGYGSKSHKKARPFYLYCDLLEKGFKVSGPEMLKAYAEQIPELAWIMRNTSISDSVFDAAYESRGIAIPFTIKIGMYRKKILEQNPHCKSVFVSRQLPPKLPHAFKGLTLPDCPNIHDYEKEMLAAEQTESVRNELESDKYAGEL